jgi:hypothetical protein
MIDGHSLNSINPFLSNIHINQNNYNQTAQLKNNTVQLNRIEQDSRLKNT